MWSTIKKELLKPITHIKGLKYYRPIIEDLQIVTVGQFYLTNERSVLSVPKVSSSTVQTINQYLSERGFAPIPINGASPSLSNDFTVSAEILPKLTIEKQHKDIAQYVLSDEFKRVQSGFSRFMVANKSYFEHVYVGPNQEM
jgi:hypothetical protein